MVAQLCDKLAKAKPGSESVIAVFCDIRSFSDFSTRVGSWNTATFLKYFYLTLLRDYFKRAAFAKPNGDGLLMIFQHDEETLEQVSAEVVMTCFKALDDFPKMFKGIHLINYATPQAIGFGIARGPASFLSIGGEKLDYSGDVLNLAARLTEYARPQGIVIDGNYQIEVVPKRLRKRFSTAKVYIRGIAEDTPIKVLYHKTVVSIPPEAFYPIRERQWRLHEIKFEVGELAKMVGGLVIKLPDPPISKDHIRVEFRFPNPVLPERSLGNEFDTFEYIHDGEGHQVTVDLTLLKRIVEHYKLSEKETVRILAHFVAKPTKIHTRRQGK